jgi:hypothetical protein
MILDDVITIHSDCLVQFAYPGEEMHYIPGYYKSHAIELNDVIVGEFNNKWYLRMVLGVPGDIFSVGEKYKRVYALYKNGDYLRNILQTVYRITEQDKYILGFDSKGKRQLRLNEYFIWSSLVDPFNKDHKGGIVPKEVIIGKVAAPVDKSLGIFKEGK